MTDITVDKMLSLWAHCQKCGGKCCIGGGSIGSPILSEDEMSRIRVFTTWGELQQVVSPSFCSYYIARDTRGEKRCPFLTKTNVCHIQVVKPLDCQCYPIKAVYRGSSDETEFVIDVRCPASWDVRTDLAFIEAAKIVAEQSIRRFDAITYDHWLRNSIGWVGQSSMPLEDFLKLDCPSDVETY